MALQHEKDTAVTSQTRPRLIVGLVDGVLCAGGPGLYCEHCPRWGQCSICGSDHPPGTS